MLTPFKATCTKTDVGMQVECQSRNFTIIIDEPEARVVRWIYRSYLSGNSKTTIQKQLAQAGIPSQARRRISPFP